MHPNVKHPRRPRGTPLDLHAVEAFYRNCEEWNCREARAIEAGDADPAASGSAVEYGLALLDLVRALRAALRLALDDLRALRSYEDDHSRAIAAVLAQARDE